MGERAHGALATADPRELLPASRYEREVEEFPRRSPSACRRVEDRQSIP